ncbi:diaminopimelate decarboxylase [Temperatibacter marinus]|uniref:Diaminopimelate decarboxylase n=1 Tax=Temperatibacter marinus TaxID=1456591 RepID=A0AA52EL39_9PROT|nr:diaminopimelate decarboxylase [Temperatibacter marinus]WND04001.1 diaminopimelate decarboxylase [Temperatibacter marinus]
MDYFFHKDGSMFAEDVDLHEIAREVGTPFYVYSQSTLERHLRVFDDAMTGLDRLICFAVKANSNVAVLKLLAKQGAGADVVSGGELKRALKAGIPGERIVFSGVGKKPYEMDAALKVGIKQFNVESEPELEVLNARAIKLGKVAPVALRINPDVDAKTHEKISTGKAENKFGISWLKARDVYEKMKEMDGIAPVGVDVHIGSQLTDLEPFRLAFTKVIEMVKDLREAGHDITQIDLGGGLGIPYGDSAEAPPLPSVYGQMVQDVVKEMMAEVDLEFIFEPGRLIAGNAGIMVSEVIYVKEGDGRKFVILDAAMNDLARPAMYDAYHNIDPVNLSEEAEEELVDFVGPVCESGDTFAKGRLIQPLEAGDLVAIKSAGAYGAVMSNSYNTRALVPEVLVRGDQFSIIRHRIEVDELIGQDQIPNWV